MAAGEDRVAARYRQPMAAPEQRRLLRRLTEVEAFERFLHKAYLGQKRFSIEGVDMLVPMLDLTIELAAELGRPRRGDRHGASRPAQRAGPHGGAAVRDDLRRVRGRSAGRGRAAHPRGRHRRREVPPRRRRRLRHRPAARRSPSRSRPIRATSSSWARWWTGGPAPSRPSAGDGRRTTIRRPRFRSPSTATRRSPARASWPRPSTSARSRDIAPAGRSTSSPTTRSASPPTWRTRARTRYACDLAKGFDIPIIHVNADDAEACLAAVRLAMAYRDRFHQDAVIDLVGYRRHGHNEGDEPAYTQPLMYERIKSHPTVRERVRRSSW